MGNIKRHHSAAFKAKVALDLIREIDTIASVCSKHGIHPTQAGKWKQQLLANAENIFFNKPSGVIAEKDEIIDELYKQIGQQKVELDWLKKNHQFKNKQSLIEPANQNLSIARQCQLLGLNRSNYYYHPAPISEEEQALMRKIDEVYTELLFYGSPRITKELHRQGIVANRKAVERLMREMGLVGLFPQKNTSKKHPRHPVFPYLLAKKKILSPNQVWGTDITFVRGRGIWFYLVAILDWYSRYVLSWQLSKTLTPDFCVEALSRACQIATPQIHNSDQGSQFTSFEYISKLREYPEIKISMDSRGRCFDNIFTERLWRTVKYEEVYLHDYTSYDEARESLGRYFQVYNHRRLHQSLNYKTPAEIYFQNQSF